MMEWQEIKQVGVVGTGTMGHAIALQFALAGYPVTLVGHRAASLEKATAAIDHDLATFKEAGLLKEAAAAVTARITPTTDYAALAQADFVIESVVEDLKVKQAVWREIEAAVSEDALLGTNTSGLDPDAIQAVLKHPARFAVAHFFNPAQLMPLVEVVPGKETAPATVTVIVDLLNHIGKHAAPLKKAALGFVGNRIQLAVLRECLHIVNEGIADPAAVDDIVKYSLGRRWSLVGPLASADLGGLDIFAKISSYLYADLGAETGADPTLTAKVAKGELGLKSGQGFFDWQGEQGKQVVAARDRALLELLKKDQEEG